MNKNKVFPILLIFILALSFSSFAQEMNADAGKLYNEGNSQLKAGNYIGAIDNYQKALKIEKNYKIYYQMGIAYKKARKLEDSKNSFYKNFKKH